MVSCLGLPGNSLLLRKPSTHSGVVCPRVAPCSRSWHTKSISSLSCTSSYSLNACLRSGTTWNSMLFNNYYLAHSAGVRLTSHHFTKVGLPMDVAPQHICGSFACSTHARTAFQRRDPGCIYGCDNADAIEHYTRCPRVHDVAARRLDLDLPRVH